MSFFHVCDFCLFRNGLAFNFEHFQRVDEIVCLQRINVACMIAVDHDRVAVNVFEIIVVIK